MLMLSWRSGTRERLCRAGLPQFSCEGFNAHVVPVRNAALVAAVELHRCIHIIVFNKSDLVPRASFPKIAAIATSEGAHSHLFLDSLRASSRRHVFYYCFLIARSLA